MPTTTRMQCFLSRTLLKWAIIATSPGIAKTIQFYPEIGRFLGKKPNSLQTAWRLSTLRPWWLSPHVWGIISKNAGVCLIIMLIKSFIRLYFPPFCRYKLSRMTTKKGN